MFKREEVSIGAWLVFMLVMMVPLVNLVMFLVLIISSETNRTMKNYLIASLVPSVLGVFFFFTAIAPLMFMF